MIIGTAGHIDHGKTALVRALTGVDTDRLAEEKKRGITIELGFAPLTIPGVGIVSIVDVPGHEAFIRTMVAGAAGIDLALLVVAADEGVMPQTREHIAILDLLGVNSVVIAVTKCDLADSAWIDAVEAEVFDVLKSTSIGTAPSVRVSAVSGMGLESLNDVIAAKAREAGSGNSADLFRLPVDRVFARAGAGTVVTGTTWSGTVAVGDDVRILPGDLRGRVRGIQHHGEAVNAIGPASRAAIAIAGVATDDVTRGDVIVIGNAWQTTTVFRANVLLSPGRGALSPRTRVRLHVGTTEVGARIVGHGGSLAANAMAPCRVVVDSPVAVRGGDRFVIRRAPEGTIGGGVVTDALPDRRRTRPFPSGSMNDAARLAHIVEESGTAGVGVGAIPVRLGGLQADWQAELDAYGLVTIGDVLFSRRHVDDVSKRVVAWLDEYHRRNPSTDAPLEGLRASARTNQIVTAYVVDQMTARREIAVAGSVVRKMDWVRAPDPDADLRRMLVTRLNDAGAAPPSVGELQRETVRQVLPVLRRLEREGELVVLSADRFSTARAALALRASVRAQVQATRGYRPSELKPIFGVSRQYLMPWLEYFDRMGWSRRQGDERWFVT
jgi:selenocysteine-specific elongation factor